MTYVTDSHLLLDVRGLSKRFGRSRLFQDLSFSMEPGQSLAVTGANGSGKSTLLRILAGVLSPDEGVVSLYVGGMLVGREERPLHVGLVAPYLDVYERFSPRENLRFIARVRRLTNAEERIEHVLESVGLADRRHALVSTFSSGMEQRMKMAAALLAEPPLLLLDEPGEHLDEDGRRMVDAVVERCVQGGVGVVVATNDAAEAKRCDQVLCVEDHR